MNKKFLISLLLTFLYAVITLIAVLHHEIWADEAQVWQLCKYLSVHELITHLHNEGHPSLFYLMVMPFAKLSSNIIYMQLICWFSMCLAVFLLLYKAPFPNIVKFAIISSAGFLYFLPIMARNYAIIPVLIFLAAILYSKQKEHPVLYGTVIVLIANTHAIMFGFALIMLFVFIYDNFKNIKEKKNIIATIIIILGIAACILQLHDTTSSNFYINLNFSNIVTKISIVFTAFFANSIFYEMQNDIYTYSVFAKVIITVFAGSLILIHYYLYKYSKKFFIISIFSFLFQISVYLLLYGGELMYVTRIFSYYIILIFCLWTGNELFNNKKAVIVTTIFFLLTAFNGIFYYINDIKYNYAGAKETAKYIHENIPQDSKLFTDNEAYCISLVYYLNGTHELYSAVREKNLKYVKWDDISYPVYSSDGWANYSEYVQAQNPNSKIYIIRSKATEETVGIDHKKENIFKKIYTSPDIINIDEGYNVYEYIGK